MVSCAPQCKDCRTQHITTHRPAPHPGPRCTTHWRAHRKHQKTQAHQRHIQNTYNLTPTDYQTLLDAQNGLCYICQKATGRTKKLAVDHNHQNTCPHPPNQGCRNCIRALLCGPCNQLIGRWNTRALNRAITVLTNPPAQQILQ
jgi:hypothetical protein